MRPLNQKRFHFAPGDEILLYTDGVTEAERKSDETFYGEERLAALLQSNGNQSC